MIKHINGDLVKLAKVGYFDLIVHGCNCYCKMKKGIAKTIASQWPQVEDVDKLFPIPTGPDRLGKISITSENSGLTIVNAYTQLRYWREPWDYSGDPLVNYDAIEECFTEIYQITNHKTRIGIPLIGAGLAGGDWDVILPIIDNIMKDRDVTVVHFSG